MNILFLLIRSESIRKRWRNLDFAIVNELSLIVDKSIRILAITLEHFLTSCYEKSVTCLGYIRLFTDQMLKLIWNRKTFPGIPFHRTVFRYANAVWDTASDVALQNLFFQFSSKIEFPGWRLHFWMDLFKHRKFYHNKPNYQSWFTPECSAAIANGYNRKVGLLLQSALSARKF